MMENDGEYDVERDKMYLVKERIYTEILRKIGELENGRQHYRGCICFRCLKIKADVWKEHITRFVRPSLLQLM